ncbi:MAG: DUF4159 domain-containing protein [Chloroflexia bacterium]
MDNAVPRVQLKRVNPFMGLMIDAQTWGDSHDYHRMSAQAHALAMHGWGIVAGLEIDAADPADRSVWVRPGVAVDPEGRLILVAQPFRYQITTQTPGLVYLVLVFREIPTQPAISVEDGTEKPSRLLEAYAIYERDRLPDQAHVELARIELSDGKSVLRDASDVTAPKANEIDTRYREVAAIRPGPRTTVGVWKPGDAPANYGNHLAGPTRLFSDLSSGVDWRLRRRDQPQGAAEEPIDADLIIMPVHAKTALSDNERKRLSAFLDGGGVLLAEACLTGGADAQRAIALVAQALGRKPKPVDRSHQLLVSRHVFAAPPAGAAPAQLFEDNGFVVSSADYCCTWNGGLTDKPLDRSVIRTAVEFAENLLAYSLIRKGNVARARRGEKR